MEKGNFDYAQSPFFDCFPLTDKDETVIFLTKTVFLKDTELRSSSVVEMSKYHFIVISSKNNQVGFPTPKCQSGQSP